MNDPWAYGRDHNLPPGVTLDDIDEQFGGDDEDGALEECGECGHLHFDPAANAYIPCPLEECGCKEVG